MIAQISDDLLVSHPTINEILRCGLALIPVGKANNCYGGFVEGGFLLLLGMYGTGGNSMKLLWRSHSFLCLPYPEL